MKLSEGMIRELAFRLSIERSWGRETFDQALDERSANALARRGLLERKRRRLRLDHYGPNRHRFHWVSDYRLTDEGRKLIETRLAS